MNEALGKLSLVRQEVSKKLTKTGVNSYAGYDFFELSDLVNPIEEACVAHKSMYYISIKDNVAILKFVDLESHNYVEISAPFVHEGAVHKATAIQCVGASLTYYRRYLLMLAFNIVEADKVDAQDKISDEEYLMEATSYTELVKRFQSLAPHQQQSQRIIDLCSKIKEKFNDSSN